MSHLRGLTKSEADGMIALDRILEMKRRKVAESLLDIRRGFAKRLEDEISHRVSESTAKVSVSVSNVPPPPSILSCVEKGDPEEVTDQSPDSNVAQVRRPTENLPMELRAKLKSFLAREIFVQNRYPSKDDIVSYLFSAGLLTGLSDILQEQFVTCLYNFAKEFRVKQHRMLLKCESIDDIDPPSIWFMLSSDLITSKHHDWCRSAFRIMAVRDSTDHSLKEIDYILKRQPSDDGESDSLPLPPSLSDNESVCEVPTGTDAAIAGHTDATHPSDMDSEIGSSNQQKD